MSNDWQRGHKRDGAGFAGRWSRLKREAKAEPETLELDTGAVSAETEAGAPEDDRRSDEEIIEELGLPDPNRLKSGDDFSAFMAKTVPARIRNRALRKLWISNPVLANLDELLDYGEDFTDAATVAENIQTAYQVGKGFVDRVAGMPGEDASDGAEEGVGEPASEPANASGEVAADEGDAGDTPDLNDPESVPEIPTERHPVSTDEWVVAEKKIPIRRRMRFRMAED